MKRLQVCRRSGEDFCSNAGTEVASKLVDEARLIRIECISNEQKPCSSCSSCSSCCCCCVVVVVVVVVVCLGGRCSSYQRLSWNGRLPNVRQV